MSEEDAIRRSIRLFMDGFGEPSADLPDRVLAHAASEQRRSLGHTPAWALGISIVVAVALVFTMLYVSRARGTDGSTPAAPPPGWRLESSLGAEIMVPNGWAVNDFGCNMTNRSSVVRAEGAVPLCFTSEPATKEVAIMAASAPGDGEGRLPKHAASIDGVNATRAEGRLADGRYAGWIDVPSRHVGLSVRTRSQATTRRILDSLRLVGTDHLGCPTQQRPALVPPPAQPATDFAPSNATAITVCYYGPLPDARLQTSAELRGSAAQNLAAAMNASAPGGNPDNTTGCLKPSAPVVDAVLLVRTPDGQITSIAATFSECLGRGLDNGSKRVHVTVTLLDMFIGPVHAGYTYLMDLPE